MQWNARPEKCKALLSESDFRPLPGGKSNRSQIILFLGFNIFIDNIKLGANAIHTFISKFYDGGNTPVSLHGLMFKVWGTATHLAGYEQQDAHEFFIAMLDALHSHFHKPGPTGVCPCVIDLIFLGRLQSAVACMVCGWVFELFPYEIKQLYILCIVIVTIHTGTGQLPSTRSGTPLWISRMRKQNWSQRPWSWRTVWTAILVLSISVPQRWFGVQNVKEIKFLLNSLNFRLSPLSYASTWRYVLKLLGEQSIEQEQTARIFKSYCSS